MAEQRITKRQFMKQHHKSSRLLEMWRIFSHNRLAMLGLVLLVILLVLIIFADCFADYTTMAIGANPKDRLQGPSLQHLLGTDELGRDIFARVIHGGRVSLRISVGSVLLGLVIAAIIGSLAGYCGGAVDIIVMRFIDIMSCVPCMVLAIALVAALGTSEFNLILALAISTVTGTSKIVRSAVLSVRNMEYVEAGRAIGQTTWKIILKHILINCVAPIIVHCTMMVATNIIGTASLSFLGMGISAPTPEWGCMIASARSNMRLYPYLVIAPGMAIFLSSVAFNLIGDGLRDALDPKMKR